MKATVEISLYPLREEFIPAIDDFIDRLRHHQELQVKVNATSTQVSGDFSILFSALQQEIGTTFSDEGKFVFAMKVLKGDLLN